VAATLWATLGIIFKALIGDYGLSRVTIAFFRASLSAVILFAALALRRPSSLHIIVRDVLFFAAFGLFGIAAFYGVYVTAIDLAGMSVAAVLLYTAPAWVALISTVFLGEKITLVKLVAVTLAMAGCALVARVYDVRGLQLNWLGILAGLGAGLTYALYSVFKSRSAPSRWMDSVGLWIARRQCVSRAAAISAIARHCTAPAGRGRLATRAGARPYVGGRTEFQCRAALRAGQQRQHRRYLGTCHCFIAGFAFLTERLDPAQLIGGGLILAAVIFLTRASLS
jgi:drug/metabolite transporter (DMT)-like permease